MRIFFLMLFVVFLFGDDINQSEDLVEPIEDLPITYKVDKNSSNIEQNGSLKEQVEVIKAIPTYSDEMNIAILLDKKRFFKFIPTLINSMNSYMIKKDIDYRITLFNIDDNISKNLDKIVDDYPYIFTFITDKDKEDIKVLNNYPDNYFFIPTLNRNQVDGNVSRNIFFGGIDYEAQVRKLNRYIAGYTIIIYDDGDLSKYISKMIDKTLLQPHKLRKYPIYYNPANYNDTYIYLNTNVVNTAQVLSNFTYKQIKPKSIFSPQIDYSPMLFSLTNREDIKNLIVANSILNIEPTIENNNLNLGSDIDFNWLNYTTSVLLNKAYLLETSDEEYFLNDFNLYIFDNQVKYKTNLYRIKQNGFIKIEE